MRLFRWTIAWEAGAIAVILSFCAAANVVIAIRRPALMQASLASVDSTLRANRVQLSRDLDEWRRGMLDDGRWIAELASLAVTEKGSRVSDEMRARVERLVVGQIPTARAWLMSRDGRVTTLVGSDSITVQHRALAASSARRDTTVIGVTQPRDHDLRIGVASPLRHDLHGWIAVLDVSATERLRRRIPNLLVAGRTGMIALTFPFGGGYVATTWLRDASQPTITWPKGGWALNDPATYISRGGELVDTTARFQLAVPRAAALAVASNRVAWMHAATLLVAMPLCIALLLIARAARNSRLRRAELELAESQLEVAQAESAATRASLAAIQARLHPHFLSNALHSASALIAQDPDAAEEALDRLGDLFRYTLESADHHTVRMTDEWRFVRDYLEIEQLRLGDRLRVDMHMDASIAEAEVPAFVLQPLVENAIRHGIGSRREGGRIVVRATGHGDDIELEVRDDGVGADPAMLAATRGTGLRTLAQRLAIEERWRGKVRIETAPNEGYAVHVRLARIDASSSIAANTRSRTSAYT